MSRRVAVLQSNYIPWKGYFDIIHDADLFVFYDDVQYTKGDWRNRNLIKTPKGTEWLTIPVGTRKDRLICEVQIEDRNWAGRHWRLLQQHYSRAPHFGRYRTELEQVYLGTHWENLTALNQHLIKLISKNFLGINTEFVDSRDYHLTGNKLDRLAELMEKTKATTYLSGPAAKAYIQPERFQQMNIELVWKDYAGYPEYPQFFPPFTHQVTILDLLFQVGPEAPRYIWEWRGNADGTSVGD